MQALPARAQAPLQPRLTRDDIINHIKFMKTLEPAYAEKALKWYSGMSPWLELPTWQELCK